MERKKRGTLLRVLVAAAAIAACNPAMKVHAESQNGEAVELPHTHSDESGSCYHHHTDQDGSCYTRSSHSHTDSCYGGCPGGSIIHDTCDFWDHHAHWGQTGVPRVRCSRCGANACPSNNDSDVHHKTSGVLICGKSYDYRFTCTKDTSVPECTDSSCGSYYVTCADTTPGSLTADLTANIDSAGAGAFAVSYSWSTGETSQGITVDVNGTYSCEVTYQDAKTGATGTATASYTVSHLDIIPPEVTLSLVTAGQEVTVHISATDNVGVTGYSFDGISFSDQQDMTVTGNGTYTGYAIDAAGNVGSASITVGCIDNLPPEITDVKKTPEGWTCGNVQVMVTAVDRVPEGYTGGTAVEYSADGQSWQSEGAFEFNDNGSYEIFVHDAAGNTVSVPISIANIERTAPEIGATQSPAGWTKDGVSLTVNAEDGQSGIPEWAYKWGDGDWNPASLYNVAENGTYTVTVRDAAGNTASYVFHVDNIDRVLPEVELELIEGQDGDRILHVQATDHESGLADMAYSFDGGITWTDNMRYEITQEGTYTVLVRDRAGNMAEAGMGAVLPPTTLPEQPVTVEASQPVSHSHPEEMEEKEPGTLTQEESEPGSKSADLSGVSQLFYEESENTGDDMQDNNTPTEPHIVYITNPDTPKNAHTHVMSFAETAILELGAAAGGGIFAMFSFFFWPAVSVVSVYAKNSTGEYKLVGRTVLRREKGVYYVSLGKRLLGRTESSLLMIRFGIGFSKRHKGEQLVVRTSGNDMPLNISREVPFRLVD